MARIDNVGTKSTQLTIDEVIREEQEQIREARLALASQASFLKTGTDLSVSDLGHGHFPVGLALSGGGIRSASFSLGILQAIAKAGLLQRFDYLSTVSGGGFIGGWLTAWIHREALKEREKDSEDEESASSEHPPKPSVKHTTKALRRVQEDLSRALRTPTTRSPAPTDSAKRNHEAEPVSWLRRYSRYLAPTAGSIGLWFAFCGRGRSRLWRG